MSLNVLPLPGRVFVTDLKRGERMVNGIILLNDDGKDHGIRPRWARVWKVGKGVAGVEVGQWVLIEHGRWSRKHNVDDVVFWAVDWPTGVLAISDEEPIDDIVKDTTTYN